MNIGLCGTGRMGVAIGQRLLDSGHRLIVYNRTPQKAAPLLERGAALASRPADVAERSEAVITVLFDDTAVRDIYLGPSGLLAPDPAGRLYIEMSTVSPDTIIELSTRAKRCGGAFVECPVGGTVGPAREGKLLGLVGGEKEDVARALPILSLLCRRIDHVGANGAGSIMKLAINLPLAVYWEALGEALSLCSDLDIPAALMLEIMCESSGSAKVLPSLAPKIVAALSGDREPDAAFNISGACKDLTLMTALGCRKGVELPVAEAARASYQELMDAGRGDRAVVSLAIERVLQARNTGRPGEPRSAR